MNIGVNIDSDKKVNINLNNLITTRLLIQSNSGGGKSYLIRKILEESHGKIQQIVIDLEGEFATLREKYDYLLIGKNGDIPLSIKTASLLARKLLELNVSSIIDISELKKHERIIFVDRFLESLIDSPRTLWHPCSVIIDEAHQFCPQSSKSDSANSVIDLMTRGRKRGFCGVIATQRISKLHKDACAEANNRLIGRTGLDIDRKRAAEELGFTSKEDERSLRYLNAGEFYAFGPSISKEITKIKVDKVSTGHPEPGRTLLKTSPIPPNIQKLLKEITDLPKEAEEELKTQEDYKRKILDLQKQVKGGGGKPVNEELLQRNYNKGLVDGIKNKQSEIIAYKEVLNKNSQIRDKINILLNTMSFDAKSFPEAPKPIILRNLNTVNTQNSELTSLRAGAMKMLGWLVCFNPESLSKQRLATLTGFSVKGGTFNTYISELKRNNWITGFNEFNITEEGLKNVIDIPNKPATSEELFNMWSSKFRAGCQKIFKVIFEAYPDKLTKEEIGESTGFEPSGGTFNTYISELRRNNLITVENEYITAAKELFGG